MTQIIIMKMNSTTKEKNGKKMQIIHDGRVRKLDANRTLAMETPLLPNNYYCFCVLQS